MSIPASSVPPETKEDAEEFPVVLYDAEGKETPADTHFRDHLEAHWGF